MTSLLLTAPICLLLAGAEPTAAPATPAAPATVLLPTAPLLDPAAAWRTARWGMTAAEVVKAFPGQARKLEKEQRLADGKVIAVAIDSVDVGGIACRAHFLFEGGKLALVSLKNLPTSVPAKADYDAVRARLAGEGALVGEERVIDSAYDVREVRYAAGGTAVDVKYMKGTLVLLYHPAGG